MRFLRLLVLIPALCLGLLGQGHGWVLCQTDRCVCLETEGLCNCVDEAAQESQQVQSEQVQRNSVNVHNTDEKRCHDSSLDAGPCVLVKAQKAPSLDFFVVGMLSFPPQIQVSHVGNERLPNLIRGPPHLSAPPQILLCLSHVVMLV